ncbi:MFS transporter [Sphingobium sp. SCG-1]|nr:MFS transporter [Sphingobium sp. SCG-1]AUW60444.1 MFS transporter [Sphingobium sp. SCG-1]
MLLGAALLVHVTFAKVRNIPEIFFVDQDFPALLGALAALALLAPLVSGTRIITMAKPDWKRIGLLILLVVLVAWAGRYLVFENYSLSRDEEMAEFAAAYMRDGRLAWPIPYEWIDYRRAIVPEFFSPFGATRFWAANYLPVNSAIRAAFAWIGDANLAHPVLLAVGLAALWHNARKLFPGRPDAVWVAMLMALTSAQLTVTAMTPYAMTGHFALNMLWLAFILRGDWKGYLGAAVILLITGGMHQWHFALIFSIGFLIWFALRRNWLALAFHCLAFVLLIVIWAKLWPAFLHDLYGPPSDIRPSAGVADKVSSLVGRVLRNWYPFAYSVRFIVWNNLLLVPLAIAGVLALGWRGLLKSETPVLPLAIGCVAGAALMTAQVYGWGFRYMHGYIGSFCLLAGYGWIALNKDRAASLRPVLVACLIAVCTTGFLAWRAHEWVAPYARSDRAIRGADADVVLVDGRGGIYASDLVRSDHGRMTRPVVLALAALDIEKLDHLCSRYSVAIFDRSAFGEIGIGRAKWEKGSGDALRAYLRQRRCGRVIRPTYD